MANMFTNFRRIISHKLRTWFPDREIEYEVVILIATVGLTAFLIYLPTPKSFIEVAPRTTEEWSAMVEDYHILPREDGGDGQFVPRVYLKQLPYDWPASLLVEDRKDMFFAAVLPLVLAENESIQSDRARLLPILQKIDTDLDVGWWDRRFLEKIVKMYDLPEINSERLRRRVAPIPVSIALAQAAIEAGWGTSRFAKEGNALFGQWVWNENAGIIPAERRAGASHAVRQFDDLRQSVRAYAHNLNTHDAYRNFRMRRASLMDKRAERVKVGIQLAGTLLRYSERREEYVSELRGVIRVNNLDNLNSFKLSNTPVR